MEAQHLMDLGGGVGFFGTLLIGALAGWIAEKVTRGEHGLITNLIIGILGAYIGGSWPMRWVSGLGGVSRLVLGQSVGVGGRCGAADSGVSLGGGTAGLGP